MAGDRAEVQYNLVPRSVPARKYAGVARAAAVALVTICALAIVLAAMTVNGLTLANRSSPREFRPTARGSAHHVAACVPPI